jgi:hypothetical protein
MRRRMSHRSSRRHFSKNSGTHRRNVTMSMRGGFRL